MKAIELAVLDNHMSEYDNDLTFEEVMDKISECDENTSVWYIFEDWDADFLIDHMRGIVSTFNSINS